MWQVSCDGRDGTVFEGSLRGVIPSTDFVDLGGLRFMNADKIGPRPQGGVQEFGIAVLRLDYGDRDLPKSRYGRGPWYDR